MKLIATALLPLLVISCSTLRDPSAVPTSQNNPAAYAVLKKSAAIQGNPWTRYDRVKVSFDGEWGKVATKIQPVLTDPSFRKSSVETYFPNSGKVVQTHTGPSGTKSVTRNGEKISVSYNGNASQNPETLDAAALVADAYTLFVFGSSNLVASATGLQLLPSEAMNGEVCHLVSGALLPGLGNSPKDQFIAWISKDTGYLLRLQFTLNGLESTKGADVDVTFSDFKTLPGGSVWPTHFIERVQRPVNIKAHEWRMTSLSLDGRKVL